MTTNSNSPSQEKFLIGTGKSQKVYVSNKWGVFTAARNLPKIGKVFVVPFSFIFGAAEVENLQEAIPKSVYMLFEQLEEHDINELFSVILSDVWVDNGTKQVDVERDFSDLAELIEIITKVLKQQYGSLLSGKLLTDLFKVMAPLTDRE